MHVPVPCITVHKHSVLGVFIVAGTDGRICIEEVEIKCEKDIVDATQEQFFMELVNPVSVMLIELGKVIQEICEPLYFFP